MALWCARPSVFSAVESMAAPVKIEVSAAPEDLQSVGRGELREDVRAPINLLREGGGATPTALGRVIDLVGKSRERA
jgi:hypothetical protein